MLGYVRCQTGEMLVKHHRLYQAMYCGLCHSIGKNVTRALQPFLSYDFVFLTFLRLLATEERVETEKQFCLLHPFRDKRSRIADNEALRYSSYAALFLTYEKMRDDLLDQDAPFFRKCLLSLYAPVLKRACRRIEKREPYLSSLSIGISRAMEKGRELERKGASLDEMCSFFASCLSLILSFGIEGKNGRILSSIGEKLGRFLYTVDALDDMEKDEKSGAFNPVLRQFGSHAEAKKHFAELDLVLSFYISEMKLALDLLEGDRDIAAVCEHIICLGLPGVTKNIMKPKTEN